MQPPPLWTLLVGPALQKAWTWADAARTSSPLRRTSTRPGGSRLGGLQRPTGGPCLRRAWGRGGDWGGRWTLSQIRNNPVHSSKHLPGVLALGVTEELEPCPNWVRLEVSSATYCLRFRDSSQNKCNIFEIESIIVICRCFQMRFY